MKLVGYYNYTVIATYAAGVTAAYGVFLAAEGNVSGAVLCLMIAGLLDMFDGKIASTMKRTEEEKLFGVQIDSLCDLVSFGVLPPVIGRALGARGPIFYVGAGIYILCAIIRLSYYNVDETMRQRADSDGHRVYYYGCPVTAAALFFPLICGLQRYLGAAAPAVYTAALFAVAVAFVVKVRLRKPGKLGIALFIALGAAIAVLVFF